MSAQMQQHKAQVRKTMRQAASENTFALEELADELKDALGAAVDVERRHRAHARKVAHVLRNVDIHLDEERHVRERRRHLLKVGRTSLHGPHHWA